MCGNSSLSSEAILVSEHWFLTYLGIHFAYSHTTFVYDFAMIIKDNLWFSLPISYNFSFYPKHCIKNTFILDTHMS